MSSTEKIIDTGYATLIDLVRKHLFTRYYSIQVISGGHDNRLDIVFQYESQELIVAVLRRRVAVGQNPSRR